MKRCGDRIRLGGLEWSSGMRMGRYDVGMMIEALQ